MENDDIVHVGDSWEFDYIAPSEAGIKAFYLDRDGSMGGNALDGTVRNLREFEERVRDH